jgi:hypothetical protein
LSAIVRGLQDHDFVTGPVAKVTTAQLLNQPAAQLFATLDFDNELTRSARTGLSAFGGNSGFRRRALAGYAPDHLFGEDATVSYRAAAAGLTKGWAEEARVLYRQPDRARAVFRRAFGSGVGRAQVMQEFPDFVAPLHSAKSLAWLFVKLPLVLQGDSREAWAWAAGRFAGTACETALPGLYLGRIRAKRSRRHAGSRGVAQNKIDGL